MAAATCAVESIIRTMKGVSTNEPWWNLHPTEGSLATPASVLPDRERCSAAPKLTDADEAALRAFLRHKQSLPLPSQRQ
jgi:hypothetical protein